MQIKTVRYRKIAYFLVIPTTFILLVLTVFPLLYSFYVSFTDYALNVAKKPSFSGLSNYISAFSDMRFIGSIFNTIKIAIPALILEVLLGLIFALVLNRKVKFRAIIVALLVTPVMIAPSAAGLSFRLLYSPQYGPINYLLSKIAGQTIMIDWLGNVKSAINSIMLVDVWQNTPFVALVLLAGLSAISMELYEAGKIDGANAISAFRYITLPMLKPVLVVVILFRTIDLVKFFDLVFVLTMGGPAASTETLSFYTYFIGLRYLRVGYGAAISFIILISVGILVSFLIKAFRQQEA